MKNKWLACLAFIIILAAFLRFFKLTEVPISLNWDEATFAYNAYSILETGKDEYGESFPLIFKSIGDYKNPLLVYLMTPSIALFGLNEFAVRLPTALIALLTILLMFLVTKEFFKDRRLALLASFLLAISPWHLQFSRAGLELPVSMFLVLLGVYGFILAKNNKWFLLLSAFSFALTLYSYYADRFFVPLFVALLAIVFGGELLRSGRKIIILSAFFGLVLILPLAIPFISSGSQEKMLMTTIFGYRLPDGYTQLLKEEDRSEVVFSLFHNPIFEYGRMIVSRYANHFSPSFLFLEGSDDNRQKVLGMGVMYLFELPFLLLGLYRFVQTRGKETAFFLLWLLLAPLPAAITRSEVHPRRAFEMVIPLIFFTAFGLDYFIEKIKRARVQVKLGVLVFGLLAFLYFFSFYLLSYYVFTPLRTFKGSGGWQYGYKELVSFISPLKQNYDKVVIDTSYQGPYIFFLFYEKYPPARYQPQANLIYPCPGCLGEGAGYDNYVFRPVYWPADKSLPKTLFAGPPERLPEKDIEEGKARILKKTYFPDGEVAFLIVETL